MPRAAPRLARASRAPRAPALPYAPCGRVSSASSALVSRSDLPFVSGAMNTDSTSPRITSPAATSMVGPTPNAARNSGVP